jgi:hypothetical protein
MPPEEFAIEISSFVLPKGRGFTNALHFWRFFFLRITARSADTRLDFLNRIESTNDDDCIGIGRCVD